MFFKPDPDRWLRNHQQQEAQHRRKARQTNPKLPQQRVFTPDNPLIWLLGREIPLDEMFHVFVTGSSSAKKSTTFMPTLVSLIHAVLVSPEPRYLTIVATKFETLEVLEGLHIPYLLVTFSYLEGYAPDYAQDYPSELAIQKSSTTLFPPIEGNNAYFRNGARDFDISATVSLSYVTKGNYTFADKLNLINADPDTLRTILHHSSPGREYVAKFLGQDIDSHNKFQREAKNTLGALRPVAMKSQRSKRVSSRDFLTGKTGYRIRVIMPSAEFLEDDSTPLSMTLERDYDICYSLGSSSRKDKIFWFDDFNFLPPSPGFRKASEFGRGFGILFFVLAQSHSGLRAKRSYGDEFDATLTNFPVQILLGANSGDEAASHERQLGMEERWQENLSGNYGGEKSFLTGNASYSLQRVSILPSSAFYTQMKPRDYPWILYHMRSPWFGMETNQRIAAARIRARLPPRVPVQLTVLPIDFQKLEPWDEERRCLMTYGYSRESPEQQEQELPLAFEHKLREQTVQMLEDFIDTHIDLYLDEYANLLPKDD
jgi:hypothetical protein